jgi:hypothetical protein
LTFPAGAVGCEVLLAESSGTLQVTFGPSVEGTFVREAPKVAVALKANNDAPLVASVSGGGFTVASSRCVDGSGAGVAGDVGVR